jgi:hypothetical protein
MMIRSFSKPSPFILRLLFWVFMAATAVDAANLDDLIPGVMVLHDDEDGLTGGGLSTALTNEDQSPTPLLPAVPHHNDRHQNRKTPSAPLRVIFDQDSPSLAADVDRVAFESIILTPHDPLPSERIPVACEALHLRLCTLLI